jgi:hypothetical protein
MFCFKMLDKTLFTECYSHYKTKHSKSTAVIENFVLQDFKKHKSQLLLHMYDYSCKIQITIFDDNCKSLFLLNHCLNEPIHNWEYPFFCFYVFRFFNEKIKSGRMHASARALVSKSHMRVRANPDVRNRDRRSKFDQKNVEKWSDLD